MYGFSSFLVGSGVVFALPLIIFIVVLAIALSSDSSKRNAYKKFPKLSAPAKVLTKRIHVYGSEFSKTDYYVTFELKSRKRIELSLSGNEYGMLAEGDVGNLKYQGDRFLGFRTKY